jgi:hypothetical protein
MNLTHFQQSYIEAALWSSTDEDGEPLDATYDDTDLDSTLLRQMHEDCADFVSANTAALDACGLSAEQAGHDFWLTRNGHGAGFWDRGIGELGEVLTDAAAVYGSHDLFVGEDGLIYG